MSRDAAVEPAPNQHETPGTPEHRAQHRITVFGSGVEKGFKKTLRNAKQVTQKLMLESGFKLATGGINSGIMRVVAQEAMRIAKQQKRKDLVPEAVAPFKMEKGGSTPGKVEYADVKRRNDREERLIDESAGIVVLNGSFGTENELLFALRRKERVAQNKPIVILDETGRHLETIRKELAAGYVTMDMFDDVYIAASATDAQVVMELYYRKQYDLEIDEKDVQKLFLLHISHFIGKP